MILKIKHSIFFCSLLYTFAFSISQQYTIWLNFRKIFIETALFAIIWWHKCIELVVNFSIHQFWMAIEIGAKCYLQWLNTVTKNETRRLTLFHFIECIFVLYHRKFRVQEKNVAYQIACTNWNLWWLRRIRFVYILLYLRSHSNYRIYINIYISSYAIKCLALFVCRIDLQLNCFGCVRCRSVVGINKSWHITMCWMLFDSS